MKDDDAKTLLALLGIPVMVLLMIIAFLPLGLFNAWTTQKMYIWFLLPLGFPAINLWHVWGITMLITHVTWRADKDSKIDKKFFQGIVSRVIGVLIMLGVSYLVKGHI